MTPINSMEDGFICCVCKRYFDEYFGTGEESDYNHDTGEYERWEMCERCDRPGGNSSDNPFIYEGSRPWPYPEDFKSVDKQE